MAHIWQNWREKRKLCVRGGSGVENTCFPQNTSTSISNFLLLFSNLFLALAAHWSKELSVTADFETTNNNNIKYTEFTSYFRGKRKTGGNIGICVTCCDIIYLFDRCFPLSAYAVVLTCRKEGFFWEIKSSSITLCDSIPYF